MKRLAVLVSGGGSNLQALIDNIEAGRIDARIALVIASKPGVFALERAKKAGIPTQVIRRGEYATQDAFDDALLAALREAAIEGVVLAGYLSILSARVVRAYERAILNIHPALIPSFCGKGYYGGRVHSAVLAYGAKVSGATVHFVDEGADTGPIILQDTVRVEEDDTPETLAARVLEVEHRILPQAVGLFCEDRLELDGRKVRIRPAK